VRLNRSETVDKQDNQLQQLVRLVQYLEALPINTVVADGVEADDVIAYIANDYLANKDSQVFIMSSDKDFYQLVDDRVHIWSPTKKKFYYTEDVTTEYGIYPTNFALYRALLGDKSDNITGVDGIGTKTVQKRFPILSQKEKLSVEDLVEYAKQQPQNIKIYQQLIQSEEILKRNIQLMQLSESNLNTSTKLRVMNTLETKGSKCNKMQIHKMLVEDRMTLAIKNADMWLRDVTQKLDLFVLQD
jgi:5'-3' exonuclease